MTDPTPDRAASTFRCPQCGGEWNIDAPKPIEMVRDLQRAVVGYSYASPYSPADMWSHLLEMVRNRDLPELDEATRS